MNSGSRGLAKRFSSTASTSKYDTPRLRSAASVFVRRKTLKSSPVPPAPSSPAETAGGPCDDDNDNDDGDGDAVKIVLFVLAFLFLPFLLLLSSLFDSSEKGAGPAMGTTAFDALTTLLSSAIMPSEESSGARNALPTTITWLRSKPKKSCATRKAVSTGTREWGRMSTTGMAWGPYRHFVISCTTRWIRRTRSRWICNGLFPLGSPTSAVARITLAGI
mmetsp:Transcript_14823/g.26147  ORF Transcript_14823/g.26147 Transcript_14823/m.26147 type:complete len:219 (+) Transcript_14823:815-1471(+)